MTSTTSKSSTQSFTLPDYLDSRYSWFRLAVSMLIATIGSVGMWSVIVVLPKIEQEFGADRSEASLPFTTIMVGFGVGNILIGRFVDRYGIALPMAVSSVLLAAGFYSSTLVDSVWMFAILQGLMVGLGTAICFGPLMSDISHWFYRRLGIAIAAAASGNYFAGTLWPLFLKGIIAAEGWRTAYVTVAIIIFSTMLPLSFFFRRRIPQSPIPLEGEEDKSTQPPETRKQVDLKGNTLVFLLTIAGVACCVAMSMPQVHIVAYCADLGYGIVRGAEMLSLMLAGGIVSRLISGVLADYIGGVQTLLIGSVLQCIALFLYMPFNGLVSLYIVSLIFGLSQGGIVPSYAIILREYLPAAGSGQRVGIVVFATVMGMAVGGWLSGLIYDLTHSYQAAFINGIGWNFINIFVMLFILLKTRKTLEQRTAAA